MEGLDGRLKGGHDGLEMKPFTGPPKLCREVWFSSWEHG
jgi:hypothetical protein